METANMIPEPESAATVQDGPAMPPGDRPLKIHAFLRRRSVWLIGTIILASAGVFGYHVAFGKAKARYATAVVERGDVESTVVAAGIIQPIKYVDVGAQTSGMLKSLKVNRGDQVEEKQLIAEIHACFVRG